MLGFAIFNGLILIVANLVVDILYGFIDPRVRFVLRRMYDSTYNPSW